MSSSNRVLAGPALTTTPQALAAPPPLLDAFVQERIREAEAAAYERGLREGAARARRETDAAARRLAEAFERLRADVRALQQAGVAADVELAEAIAEAVVARIPHDGGRALLDRLSATLAQLDDRPLVVRVHRDDRDLVAAALAARDGVSVDADDALAPGEATITGPFAGAELTRASAWEVVRAVLREAAAEAAEDGPGDDAPGGDHDEGRAP